MDQHIAIVGATASGKTSVSIDLAKMLNREVISLDSMQIYRGMEIGTGAVPFDLRQGVEHHMLGIVEPEQIYSVSNFQNDVKKILVNDVDKKYVFAGGTGLYTHAVIDNFALAPTDESIRKSIEEKFNIYEENTDEESLKKAYEHLKELDEKAAEKIDPGNVRRIVRALEVIELTGAKFSDTGEGVQTFKEPAINVKIIGLRYTREVLKERIIKRVNEMFDSGWIQEVERLEPGWELIAPNAKAAIGYQNIIDFIRAGKPQEQKADLIEKIVNKTSQFSRRQRKWFERDPRIIWIDCDNKEHSVILEQVSSA